MDAGVGPARVPAIEIRLGLVQALEAQALERRRLRVADGRLDLPLAIGMPDATGQRDRAVMREDVAVERVEGGIVDVRGEDALLEVIEDDRVDRPAEPTEGLLVQLGPAARARLEGEQADALAAVAQGEDEQPGPAVLARDGVADHRPGAVVDLAFLAGGGDDHRMSVRRALAAELPHEAAHAGVAGREAVLIDEVLPDRHGVAAAAQGQRDQLAVRLTGAGGRSPLAGRGPRGQVREARREPLEVGGPLTGRICRVGGHRTGRFWRWPGPARPADRDPSRLEIGARRLATDSRRLFNAAERPAQPPQSENLLLSVVPQDVGHSGGRPQGPLPRQRPGASLPHWPGFRCPRLAGFGCPPRGSDPI